MKTVCINTYSGARHNRYDGYQSSWGVLMALGASRYEDCFANEDDYPDEKFTAAWEGNGPFGDGDCDEFRMAVLRNLDDDIPDVFSMKDGEEQELTEYWGQHKIRIVIRREGNGVVAHFDPGGDMDATYEVVKAGDRWVGMSSDEANADSEDLFRELFGVSVDDPSIRRA